MKFEQLRHVLRYGVWIRQSASSGWLPRREFARQTVCPLARKGRGIFFVRTREAAGYAAAGSVFHSSRCNGVARGCRTLERVQVPVAPADSLVCLGSGYTKLRVYMRSDERRGFEVGERHEYQGVLCLARSELRSLEVQERDLSRLERHFWFRKLDPVVRLICLKGGEK